MSSRPVITVLLSVAVLVGGGLSAGAATAGTSTAGASAQAARPATSPDTADLPAPVSQSTVSYTPNVYEGTDCGAACKGGGSMIWSTALVNGEVVVAGAFTQVCTPASASPAYAECPATVTADYVFAYDPATGAIDPGFQPVLNTGPVYSVAAGPDDSVIIGGSFSTVNGVSTGGLASLYVTPGQSTDGTLVPGFAGQVNGSVTSIATDGTALYVAGRFTKVDGLSRRIVRLNSATGALDNKFKFTIADAFQGQNLHVKTIALSPDGSTLAMAGTFQSINGTAVPRLALVSTGGGLGKPATLDDWAAPIMANTCSHQHDYVDGIDFSPDGSYFVIADTGYQSNGQPGVCDAGARFETGATGDNVQPAWVNYTGGDSMYAVVVTGSTVYLGGHQRWANNECGNNAVCENNAVLVDGLAAIDANTGVALPWWHPQTGRGSGIHSLTALPAGAFPRSHGALIIGTDVDNIGGVSHHELAMLPETATAAPAAGGPIQSGMFSDGRLGGVDESGQGTAAMCLDDSGDNSGPGSSPAELVTCANDNEQNWTLGTGQTITVNGLCLDTDGTSSGSPAVVDSCGGGGQQWQQGAGNTLVNVASGLCLDDPGASTNNGTQLDIDTCSGATSQQWPLPAAQAPPPPPPAGSLYLQIEQARSGQAPCATISKNSASPGAAIVVGACRGQKDQEWTLEANGTIENGKGLCLDTQNQVIYAGVPIVQATCNGSNTQVWVPGPSRSLGNAGEHGMCLDDPASDTSSGTQFVLYYCNGQGNQAWWLPTY